MATIHIPDIKYINKVAQEFLALWKNHYFFAFYGDLGAGKTTFIKAICKALGTRDNVVSPTFSLVNEYHIMGSSSNATVIYHMDFYRLKDLDEALDIGVVDYFKKKNCYCFIEWPEIIESLLPKETLAVNIVRQEDNSRIIRIKP